MEMKDVLISAVISVVVAALTGWFTAKQSYRKEIKKTVYEERQKLYIELFSLLEKLQNRPFLIYNYEQFIQPFRLIKARTNLYASRKVLEYHGFKVKRSLDFLPSNSKHIQLNIFELTKN